MPQPWITTDELAADVVDVDVAVALEAVASASYLLWAMSGRKYSGIQTVEETYECACASTCGPSARTYTAVSVPNGMLNLPRGGCSGTDHRLRLRGRPILAVHEVISEGKKLSTNAYSVLGRHTLMVHSSSPCTVTVTYTFGQRVPYAGRVAARKLAGEFVKLWMGSEECTLPDRVTSVSRQGVSYTILDNQDFLAELRTGVYEVDLFLKVTNPDNARKPARVLSPDMPRLTRARRLPGVPIPIQETSYDITIASGTAATWVINLSTVPTLGVDFATWTPVGQIVDQYGTPMLEIDATHFMYDPIGNTLTGFLSAEETAMLSLAGGETWDLYARDDVSGSTTLIYVLSGNVIRT